MVLSGTELSVGKPRGRQAQPQVRPFIGLGIDARLARRWTWQGREVEAALVGQNLGEDYAEFRDTNVFSRRVYGSLSFAW